MHETLTVRTIWVAKCSCTEEGLNKQYESDPPREIQCPKCGKWIEPEETSYTGKDKFTIQT